MNKELKATKKNDVRLLIHPGVMESGVYDATFIVNGNIVERGFEVDVIATYDYESDTNYYNLRDVTITASCCNEENDDIADIMERKLEEAIENYMWSKLTDKEKQRIWRTSEKQKRKRI